jgi:hypothetical protein
MRSVSRQPTTDRGDHLRAGVADEERELALLAQFMRHESVASLANAIAKPAGVRGEDLIAAAGLDRRCGGRSNAIRLNEGAGLGR